jgi:D-xylose 1-dehydrogenase (NADP+, D-xylono-1,5-lactone-forming)
MLNIRKKILRRLRWGVAGCGNFAENSLIPTLQVMPKSKLVSLYSGDINRAKSLADKYAAQFAFNNYDEFLTSEIDCVYISSANVNHYEQVIKAARAGKNIMCEKPLAMSYEQSKEMVEECERNKVLLAVNYVHQYHPLVLKAKEIIDKDMLGKIVSVRADFNIDFAPNENYRFKKALSGGGALRDIGTHMINLIRFLGGEIIGINGVMDNIVYKSEVEDFAAAILKFEKGGYGFFNVSYSNRKAFNRIEVLGYKGCISIENLIGRKTAPSKLIIDLNNEAKRAFRKRGNKLLFALRSVQKAFLKNQQPLVTGRDGMINMKIMEDLENKCLLGKN